MDSVAPVPSVDEIHSHLCAGVNSSGDYGEQMQLVLLAALEGKIKSLGHADAYFLSMLRRDPHGIKAKSRETNISAFDFDGDGGETFNFVLESAAEEDSFTKDQEEHRHLDNNTDARLLIEKFVWPNGPFCPHCKATDVYRMTPRPGSKKPGRDGLHRCRSCEMQFTATVGTIFHRSHIPLSKWASALRALSSRQKTMTSKMVVEELGIGYVSAWFLRERICNPRFKRRAKKARSLSGPEIREAYSLYIPRKHTGNSIQSLARKYSVCRSEIRRAVSGKAQTISS